MFFLSENLFIYFTLYNFWYIRREVKSNKRKKFNLTEEAFAGNKLQWMFFLLNIWILLKTFSQKWWHILKPVTLVTLMFLGFINTKITYNYKLLSISNLHSSTILLASPFFGEKCSLSHFLENKHNSNPHTLCKVGVIQPWLIKTTCFTYLLLQIKPVIIKTFHFKFENVPFT